MIPAAVVVALALAACKSGGDDGGPKRGLAKVQARELATAYPKWHARSGSTCPDALVELLEYTTKHDASDPWGRDYEMVCGADAPPAAKGFGVRSAGADGKHGTADDVTSWD